MTRRKKRPATSVGAEKAAEMRVAGAAELAQKA